MALNLMEVSTAGFHTTREADQQCERLKNALGYKVNYLVARLAIARSLALSDVPVTELKDGDDDDNGAPYAVISCSAKGRKRQRGSLCWCSGLIMRNCRDVIFRDWCCHTGNAAPSFSRTIGAMGRACPASSTGGRRRRTSGGVADWHCARQAGHYGICNSRRCPDRRNCRRCRFRRAGDIPLNAPGGSPHIAIMVVWARGRPALPRGCCVPSAISCRYRCSLSTSKAIWHLPIASIPFTARMSLHLPGRQSRSMCWLWLIVTM